jgi:NAD(P)-dependent dehydrogenase (short-subunit alcohol dehydrogenase family)
VSRVALVTGANRGIGREAARQLARAGLFVVATGRDRARMVATAEELDREGIQVQAEELDVADPESVTACASDLRRAGLTVDVLVNNAAILLDEGGSAVDLAEDVLRRTLETNLLGPVRTCRAFVPGMVERGYGRVVNVSSGAGSLARMGGYAPAYSISKAALNALTRQLAAHVHGDVKVNAVDPGWVRTDMGGPGAPGAPEKAVETIVWLATLPIEGPSGGFFYQRRPAEW